MKTTLRDNLIRLESIDSTNSFALKLANEKAGDFAVTAECQTKGRGRMGRDFESPKGQGLYLSVLERRVLDPGLTARVAVCIAKGIEKVHGLYCDIKWPNDIQVNGKKLCGILCERMGGCVVIGFGINLLQSEKDFGELKDIATSLALCGIKPDKEALICAILDELDIMLDNYGQSVPYLDYYRAHSNCTGRDIYLISGNQKIPAHCTGITDDFELAVRLDDGSASVISSGEISLRFQ